MTFVDELHSYISTSELLQNGWSTILSLESVATTSADSSDIYIDISREGTGTVSQPHHNVKQV